MFSWEEKPFQPPNRARGPWEEIHTSGWWLVKSRASLQMGLEELADLSGRWSNSGMFTSGKHSVMPTASPTAARESSSSSLFFFFFVYRVVSIQGFGRETPHRSAPTMEAWYTPTLPNRSRLCPHLHSTCIDFMPSDVVTHVNSSILRKQRNKKKKTPSPTAISVPPHSSDFLRLESRWRWWKTGSNWGRKQNRYKPTPATRNRIGHSASRDTFETSAYLYACLPSETFAVSVALPALSHPVWWF